MDYPHDMQALLKSTQKNWGKKTTEAKAKRGCKTIPKYDAFSVHYSTRKGCKEYWKNMCRDVN